LDVPFHKPYITDDEISEVVDSLRTGWVTTGPKAKEFEKEFARYVGAKHAVAVNSCTAALHLALEAVGVRENDLVVTTPMTFAATAEVIRYFNARPVFVDIDPRTLNMDPEKFEETVRGLVQEGRRPRTVIPVHYGGQPCEMDAVMSVAREHGLRVIEDSAHALPAFYRGKSIGTIGDITCFSFYATKNITTGEGGMAVTDNPEWAERMQVMSLHGISKDAWKRYTREGGWYYEIIAPGFKYNLTDIAAALGLAQLRKAGYLLERRQKIASLYDHAFREIPEVEIPAHVPDTVHSRHLYVIRLNLKRLSIDRDRFIIELRDRGISTSVHFIPLHIHPYYRETYGYRPEDFPVAYGEYRRIISLPIYPAMTDGEAGAVAGAVAGVAKKFRR